MDLQVLKAAYRFGVLALLLSSIIACNSKQPHLPYYNTADFTPLWTEEGMGTDTLHRIADFSFTDQDGKVVNNESFKAKVYIANFFFTSCPSICPKMMRNMKRLTDSFKKDENIKFISHSVTPEIDSVKRLQTYAERMHIDERQWHLVTGNKSQIYELARRSYFAEENIGFNKDSTEFLHTEHFLLIDKDGHLRGVYNGTLDLDIERLKQDIHTLLKE